MKNQAEYLFYIDGCYVTTMAFDYEMSDREQHYFIQRFSEDNMINGSTIEMYLAANENKIAAT